MNANAFFFILIKREVIVFCFFIGFLFLNAKPKDMSGKMNAALIIFVLFAVLNFGFVQSNPAIATGYEPMEICIENCAQCKKMFGPWFEGPLCAESCIKFKGKLIPECEDFSSIASYLNVNKL